MCAEVLKEGDDDRLLWEGGDVPSSLVRRVEAMLLADGDSGDAAAADERTTTGNRRFRSVLAVGIGIV